MEDVRVDVSVPQFSTGMVKGSKLVSKETKQSAEMCHSLIVCTALSTAELNPAALLLHC